MAAHNLVLYEAKDRDADRNNNEELTTDPSFTGRTFYVDTKAQRGFRVSNDVKVVFIQTNNNKETVRYEDGYQRMESVLDRLHTDDNGDYWFEVSAVIDNYVADVVIIRDLIEAGVTVTPPTAGDHHVVTADYDGRTTFTISITDGCAPTYMEIADAITETLEDEDATNIDVVFDATGIKSVSFTTARGTDVTLDMATGLAIITEHTFDVTDMDEKVFTGETLTSGVVDTPEGWFGTALGAEIRSGAARVVHWDKDDIAELAALPTGAKVYMITNNPGAGDTEKVVDAHNTLNTFVRNGTTVTMEFWTVGDDGSSKGSKLIATAVIK